MLEFLDPHELSARFTEVHTKVAAQSFVEELLLAGHAACPTGNVRAAVLAHCRIAIATYEAMRSLCEHITDDLWDAYTTVHYHRGLSAAVDKAVAMAEAHRAIASVAQDVILALT